MAKPSSSHRSATGPDRTQPIEIIPLGGLGEFGMNMMVYRCGETILVVDVGLMFPHAETPGVDLLLPDITYLEENRARLAGIVLTHGHEDHIGALPFLIDRLAVPIYGTKLTTAIVRHRLSEHALADSVDLRAVAPGERFRVGVFELELIHVTHSLADCAAVAIHTPEGTILHTGDFKVDANPRVDLPIDVKRLAELGDEGVLCLLSDSTNAEVPGKTPSETHVTEALDQLVRDTTGRVLLVCFTSSTHRIQIALDIAVKHGRKVALVGRSMMENTRIAMEQGFIEAPRGLLVAVEDLEKIPAQEQLVLAAGSQGEPMSALAQISMDTHRFISVGPGDRVILSARVIPGNERNLSKVINRLFRLGAEVIHPRERAVHVSGHASAEDLSMVFKLVKPRNFIPIHGEWRQLYHHANIARSCGMGEDQVFVAEDGDVVRFEEGGARLAGPVESGQVLLDSSGLGLVDDCVVRDRRRLSAAGVLVPMISFSAGSSRDPEVSDILSRGFIDNDDGEALLNEAHDAVLASLQKIPPGESRTEAALEQLVESTLKRFFRKKSMRRPVILPVVVEH